MQYFFIEADKETREILKTAHDIIISDKGVMNIDEADFREFMARADRIQAAYVDAYYEVGDSYIFSKKVLDVCALPNGQRANEAIVYIVDTPNVELHTPLFLLHRPHQDGLCDRVFIFAHELGHALHLALTHDIEIFPDSFDEFDNPVEKPLGTPEEKQEAFADSVALAILHCRRLGTHFPTDWSKQCHLPTQNICEGFARKHCEKEAHSQRNCRLHSLRLESI
jgi:hypothetical protein